ncbi:S1C family serine protease [Kitasatospora kifunensis]|uniref:Putative serine protease PepD n=1 Tax=Kitasatospora kifunensis TaxID=58351 RepID=A0A7W7RA34_KITKI|nr:trypsin-like peptidase domain-containing protein [Kitasatospora kifunensis]MBB4928232.1 putative serine protease PepD [Kitasatospora kifunensis]
MNTEYEIGSTGQRGEQPGGTGEPGGAQSAGESRPAPAFARPSGQGPEPFPAPDGRAAEPAPATQAVAEQSASPYAVPVPPFGPDQVTGTAAHAEHCPFDAAPPLGGGWGPGPGEPSAPVKPPGQSPKKRGGLVTLAAAVALVTGVLGGVIGTTLNGDSPISLSSGSSHSSTTTTASDNVKALSRVPDSIAGIAAKALPGTVTIKADGSQESGTGTGWIFDTEGHVITNNHVVAPAQGGGKLTVKFSDGSECPASVVGQAKGYDIAVLKLYNPPAGKLVPLPLGDSDKVAVGDAAIAIGAPYDLESTVTSGIISAKNRPVASSDERGVQASYMNALQTDASINPGNSGGPLLNANGQVIGIDSAIESNSNGSGRAGSIGLGFAIPINQAKRVAQMLIQTGIPVYPILGMLRNDQYSGDGAQIATNGIQDTPAVTPGGPADQAGLKPGDVITKLGDVLIDNGPALVSEIWTHTPGDKIPVQYTRNGQTMTTTVTLGSRTGDQI